VQGIGYTYPDSTIDATYNWWGVADSSAIAQRIYDHSDNPSAARVQFVPFLDSPISTGDPDIQVSPPSLYATVFPESTAIRQLLISNTGTGRVLSFSITEGAPGQPVPGDSAVIQVSFSGAGMIDSTAGAFLVVSSNDPDEDPIVIPVTLVVSQVLVWNPGPEDSLFVEEEYEVTWSTVDSAHVQEVDLYFSADAGETYESIATGEPNDYSFLWLVPASLSDSCKIRIVAHYAGGGEAVGHSYGLFVIAVGATGISASGSHSAPSEFSASQNFPNPFNPATSIPFGLPEADHVRVEVFDALGRRIAVVADAGFTAGWHRVSWNGTDHSGRPVPSGIYLYKLTAGRRTASGKMVLAR
jgi:hypothetical protein